MNYVILYLTGMVLAAGVAVAATLWLITVWSRHDTVETIEYDDTIEVWKRVVG